MRDILLVACFAIALPMMVRRPAWGALGWAWFGIMNPHRHVWGFAYSLPFANAIFVATALGALLSKEPKRLKGGAATFVLILFVCYMAFTTLFALSPGKAWPMLDKVVKIQLGTLLVLLILHRKEHVIALIWVLATSIGFYAVKGGLFTIATMGQYRVWGPPESFIQENNALALATVISIPLWAYLYTQYKERTYFRIGIVAAIALSAVSAIGSHSRGAVVAIVATAIFLWLKSRKKLAIGILIVVSAIGLVAFMPESWSERITTITNPRDDASANGRLETWTMLFNLAKDRPFTGGGFQPYEQWIVEKYNPAYTVVHSAHSNYFQVLGENGFVALLLFLTFWALVWRMCSQITAMSRQQPDADWAYWLGQMIKVSLVAYLVGGAFLNLAHWDVPYYLFVAVAVTRYILRQTETTEVRAPVDGEAVKQARSETVPTSAAA